MLNTSPKLHLTATMFIMVLVPFGYAQNMNMAVDSPAAKVRANTTNINAKMPAQPSISPELDATIKATMPTSATMLPATKAYATKTNVTVTANTGTTAQTMEASMAELEQATSDIAMDAAEVKAEAEMAGAMTETAAVQVDERNPMAPKVNVTTSGASVQVDASTPMAPNVNVTAAQSNAKPAPQAVDAQTFAKLQAMIPTAKSMISGSDILVQAPTFILRVPVSRTDAFNELHLTPKDSTSMPANMPTNISVDVETNPPTTE